MRKNRKIFADDMNIKVIRYACIGIGILAIIVLGLLIYSKNLNNEVRGESLKSEQFAELMNKTNTNIGNTESASTEIGKTVNEVANEMSNHTNSRNSTNSINNTTERQNVISTTNTTNNKNTTSVQNNVTKNENIGASDVATSSKNENNANNSNSTKQEEKKELAFSKPVEGEIMKDFSKDNLIYSNTLEEWTTHTGIDIKAEKTTVVKAAEAGMVKSIKNDPRYGLTIVLEHDNGFQTVYSNLLTSEFVVEGEKIEKGQSLGTVGNTAAFEIADEPHLHFEILKDNVAVDPNIYIK